MNRDIKIGDWTKLGSTIRAERKRHGFSQQVLASRAGISRSWLARIEAGHRGAEFEQILKLLQALDLILLLRSPHGAADQSPTEGISGEQQSLAGPPGDDGSRSALEDLLDRGKRDADRRRQAWAALSPESPWSGTGRGAAGE